MSASTPVCQLLERQAHDYRGWLWVAPPRDAWLESGTGQLLSADHGVLDAWRDRERPVYGPFDELPTAGGDNVPPGAVLFWPKSHALGEWWLLTLCQRLPEGTPLQVVGENNGGVKHVLKVLAALGLGCRKRDSARRCTLFETRLGRVGHDPDEAWQHFSAAGLELVSHPGVFGHGKFDEGTRLLLETLEGVLPERLDRERLGRVLDVGCGDGVISAWLARRGATVTAVDINAFAVEATRRTLHANGLQGEVLGGDVYAPLDSIGAPRDSTGTSLDGAWRFELIVSNPPFHQEREIDYGPAARLIREAPLHLDQGGELILVANAFLPYPDLLKAAFGNVEILADDRRFRVYRSRSVAR